jgi:homoisocitrate dehydrogenase
MQKIVTLINGDGIGAEVIPMAHRVLEKFGLPITFQYAQAGFHTFEQTGNALPDKTLALCQNSDAVLFGATQSPMGKVAGYSSPILGLRKHFDLFANLRPALMNDIDMLIVRENTEGMYSRRERVEDDGNTAILERIITRHASQRIVRLACEHAMKRRKHLTIVHKANVLKETCGLFRTVALEVVRDFPDLTVHEQLVDSCAMFMVQNPQRFDVIVTTNLFGDILSDLAAGLTGGLGIAPSANVGIGKTAVFEPVHGSAPDIVGKGIADPRAAILSGAMLLAHLGFAEEATRLQNVTYHTAHEDDTENTAQAIINQIA